VLTVDSEEGTVLDVFFVGVDFDSNIAARCILALECP
jgi:hypothetical protein